MAKVGSYPNKIPRYLPKRTFPQTYRYPIDTVASSPLVPRGVVAPLAPTSEMMVINGKPAQSKNEWYLYRALLLSGIPSQRIRYQVPWHGGRQFGGQVLDFVIYLGGAPYVIRVMGKYWHPTEYGTPLDVYTYHQLTNEGYIVKDIPDTQIKTMEAAEAVTARLNL